MSSGAAAHVSQRGDCDYRKALLLRRQRDLDGRSVTASVGEHNHAVARLQRIALEKHLRVPLVALQPQQFTRATRADHIEPHQSWIVEREEADKAPVA